MADDHSQQFTFGRALSLATAYAVSVAVIYVWGYWPQFDVNFIAYTNIPELLRLSAYPLVSMLVTLAIGAAMGEILSISPGIAGASIFAQLVRRAERHPRLVQATYAAFIVGSLAWPSEKKWLALMLLLGGPIWTRLKNAQSVSRMIRNESARSIVVYVLICFPFVSFYLGRTDGKDVLEGRRFFYMEPNDVGGDASRGCSPTDCERLLGNAGDLYFLWNPNTKSVRFYKLAEGASMTFAKFHFAKEAPASGP